MAGPKPQPVPQAEEHTPKHQVQPPAPTEVASAADAKGAHAGRPRYLYPPLRTLAEAPATAASATTGAHGAGPRYLYPPLRTLEDRPKGKSTAYPPLRTLEDGPISAKGSTAKKNYVESSLDNSVERVASDLTSIFETGGRLYDITTGDSGGISYGRNQATIYSGTLQTALNKYIQYSANSRDTVIKNRGTQMAAFKNNYEKLNTDYLTRVHSTAKKNVKDADKSLEKDKSKAEAEVKNISDLNARKAALAAKVAAAEKKHQAAVAAAQTKQQTEAALVEAARRELVGREGDRRANTPFIQLLRAAQKDEPMLRALSETFRIEYWAPASGYAAQARVRTPLGLALFYDNKIHGGLNWDYPSARKALGGNVGDINKHTKKPITETEFLKALLAARKARLVQFATSRLHSPKERDRNNARDLLLGATQTRLPQWEKVLESGNFELTGEITFKDMTVKGLQQGYGTNYGTGQHGPPVHDNQEIPEILPGHLGQVFREAEAATKNKNHEISEILPGHLGQVFREAEAAGDKPH